MTENNLLVRKMQDSRNAGYHLRLAFGEAVNRDPAHVGELAGQYSDQLTNFYQRYFGPIDGAEIAVTIASARDLRVGLMTAIGHRVAMESIPTIRSLLANGLVLPTDFIESVPTLKIEGTRNRFFTGIETFLVQQHLDAQKDCIKTGLETFGKDLSQLESVFKDLTQNLKNGVKHLLGRLGVDFESPSLDPSNKKRHSPFIRKTLMYLGISEQPKLAVFGALQSGSEIAAGIGVDARRALHVVRCTDESQVHMALLLSLEVMAQASVVADLTAEERYVQRRNKPGRKLPFAAVWSAKDGRHRLISRYPLKVPQQHDAGICSGSEVLEPVIPHHVKSLKDLNRDLSIALAPAEWPLNRLWTPGELSMLTIAALTHALINQGVSVLPSPEHLVHEHVDAGITVRSLD